MLKFEQTFEFTLILRIFRHFIIIKIVTHLEVLLQNVKDPKAAEIWAMSEIRAITVWHHVKKLIYLQKYVGGVCNSSSYAKTFAHQKKTT
jgi:hypothetical protein